MNLAAFMSLENRGFLNPLNQAKSAVGGFSSLLGSMKGPLAALGISFGAFKSVEGFTEGLKKIFDLGKELKTSSAITGQAVGDLVVLKKAYQEAGLDAGSLTQNLAMMQTALGGVNEEGQPTKHVFEQIGLSIDQLKGKSSVDQLDAIGKAIGGMADQESKMAATRAIFGRAGAPMLALFGDPKAIDHAKHSMAEFGGIMQKDAGMFKQIANALESLGGKVKGFFLGVADKLGPVLLPVLEKLKNTINLIGTGQKFGEQISLFVQAFKDGNIGEYAGLSLKAGFVTALEFLAEKVPGVFDGLGSKLSAIFDGAITMFKGLGMVIGAALKQALVGATSGMNILGKAVMPKDVADTIKGGAELESNIGGHVMEAGLAKMGTSISGQFGDFIAALGKDGDDAKAGLAALKTKLTGEIEGLAKLEEAAPKGTGTFANVKDVGGTARKDPFAEGDRLAKIGLFVGSGGPQNDHARKTADNTKKLTEQIQTLISSGIKVLGGFDNSIPYTA